MPRAGRKPKPTALKELAGNPGGRPLNDAEPRPEPAGDARPPYRLMPKARRFWLENAPRLDALGLLSEIDLPAFQMMATHFGVAVEAAEVIKAEGIMTKDEHGLDRKHPALQVLRDNSGAFRAYAAEFGMTPSSRSRVRSDAPEEQMSLADALFAAVRDVQEVGDDGQA
jgi:P27 family predicted phage terminase small subunit